MMEIWKDVPGFSNLYQVSNLGNVRSITRYKKVLKPQIDKDGYRSVILKNKGIEKHFRVCRLVATVFVPNPHEKDIVNHIDLNRQNDCDSNLEWCTAQENVTHSVKLGRYNGHGHKPVIQLRNGEVVKIWHSLSDASRGLNIPIANISKCLSGKRKSAGGFEWKLRVDTRIHSPQTRLF
jgi:hypothetical protein